MDRGQDHIYDNWGSIRSFIQGDREGRRWSKEAYSQTEKCLAKLFAEGATLSESALNHFLTGYQAYCQLLPHLSLLKAGGSNQEVRTRLYRLPFYSAMTEGCLSNLLRAIVLIIDSNCEKDYSMQNDLGPLCDISRKHGFIKLANAVDLKIRNAISHGRVNTEGLVNEIVLQSKIGSDHFTKRMTNYEFDRELMQTLDIISGALLSFCQVFGKEIQSIQLETLSDDYVRLMVAGLGFSDNECRCINASKINKDNEEQINFVFSIGVTDNEVAFRKAGEILLAAHNVFRNCEHYSVSFQNERLTGNIFIAKKEEIELVKSNSGVPRDLISLIIRNKNILWNGFGKEDVNIQQIKYFRFPEYDNDNFAVRDVEDVSLDDRKRLKGNMFIGEEDEREEIVKSVALAIEWMKSLYNPPSLVTAIKHGSIEADCVFLNVYRDDNLRDNRSLMQNNTNFVCSVEYCTEPKFALKENNFVKYLYQNKDIDGFTTLLWREKKHTKKHIYANVGRNDTCPCGSEKKFKKCHGANI